jgi:hypothetical protein
MITVTIPYQNGDFIFRLANWFYDNGHGAYSRDNDNKSVLRGPSWSLYHTTENYRLVTKAEFDNKDIAAMFALRWA